MSNYIVKAVQVHSMIPDDYHCNDICAKVYKGLQFNETLCIWGESDWRVLLESFRNFIFDNVSDRIRAYFSQRSRQLMQPTKGLCRKTTRKSSWRMVLVSSWFIGATAATSWNWVKTEMTWDRLWIRRSCATCRGLLTRTLLLCRR